MTTTKTKARATFDEKDNIKVEFAFDWEIVQKIKTISGARFVPAERGGPHWTFPKEFDTAKRLRRLLGKTIRFSEEMTAWGKAELELEGTLIELAMAEDAELEMVPDLLPEMNALLKPYQRAGIKFATVCPHPLIADQPGLGKTWEAVGTIFESGLDIGKHLVIAPKTSLENTWLEELGKLQPYAVFVAEGSGTSKRRMIEEFMAYDEPAWLVTNPATVQFVRQGRGPRSNDDKVYSRFPELYEIAWDSIILDECHKAGLRDHRTLTARGLLGLSLAPGGKRIALSGTPMGGKPINLWPILHFLDPEEFTSKWRWAAQWMEIQTNAFGKQVGDIKPELQEEFDRYITRYMLRRTKGEVFKDLPPKQYVPVWVDMGPKQAKQYKEFAMAAEVKIEEDNLTATGILAEYLRLKQLAMSHSKIEWIDRVEMKYKVIPDGFKDSPKLEALEQLLEERGIFDDEQDTDEQVVIFSQFSTIVDWVYNWLTLEKRIKCLKITGDVKQKDRNAAKKEFQREEVVGDKAAKVIVMTTTAGGVSITLDMADTVIFLDETWVPDDQEQGEDRIHRVSRIHQVTCYYIRTRDTIEEYIQRKTEGKQNVNIKILDLRREGLRAV